MNHIVKIFECDTLQLEVEVNEFIAKYEQENLGHLHVFGITRLDFKEDFKEKMTIWATFEAQPASEWELAEIEMQRNIKNGKKS